MSLGQKILNAVHKLEELLISLVIFSMVSLTILNIVLRYAFSYPIKWYEEVVLFLFVWITMLGLCMVYRNQELITIDIIDNILPEKYQKILSVFIDLIIASVLISLINLGWQFSVNALVKLTDILRIPYFYIDLSVVVGSFLCMKDMIVKYILLIKGAKL